MSPLLDRLHTTLQGLGLTEMDTRLESCLEGAVKGEPSYADFLAELLTVETEARSLRSLQTRLRVANLPANKTLAQFDFAFQPSLDERQIRELQTLRFAQEAENVILLGPPGVGKTHLAVGLAIEAIRGGFSAYFVTAYDLVTDLGKAAREGKLERRLRVYLHPNAAG